MIDAEDEHRPNYDNAVDVSNIVSAIVKAYTCLTQRAKCVRSRRRQRNNKSDVQTHENALMNRLYSKQPYFRIMHNIKRSNNKTNYKFSGS